MKVTRFEDLEIWQEAREICKLVYRITSSGPFEHDFKFRDLVTSEITHHKSAIAYPLWLLQSKSKRSLSNFKS